MLGSNEADTAALPARQRVLVTAHRLFYRDGIRATGIDRVIAESGVTKVTFYRHFPSKHDLVLAYLDHRHALWMAWFRDALQRHAGGQPAGADALAGALLAALGEWFGDDGFRGCAFINAAVELGGSVEPVLALVRQHKQDLVDTLAQALPAGPSAGGQAESLALAIDGAIVQAQSGRPVAQVLVGLRRLVAPLLAAGDAPATAGAAARHRARA